MPLLLRLSAAVLMAVAAGLAARASGSPDWPLVSVVLFLAVVSTTEGRQARLRRAQRARDALLCEFCFDPAAAMLGRAGGPYIRFCTRHLGEAIERLKR